MNQLRRNELKNLKHTKRLKVFAALENKPVHELIKDPAYFAFKNSGKPCSCFMCRNEKYSRTKSKQRIICQQKKTTQQD